MQYGCIILILVVQLSGGTGKMQRYTIVYWGIFLSFMMVTVTMYGDAKKSVRKKEKKTQSVTAAPCLCPKRPWITRECAREKIKNIVTDVVHLNLNIFHQDTFKVIATLFPVYIGCRMIDMPLQSCFYDRKHHKNVNQIHCSSQAIAKWSIGLPILFLGSQAFLSKDPEMRATSYIYLLGFPFVIWTKNLLKQIPFEANCRPWNEHFSCYKRAQGGFPSGHMAEATYAVALYAMRFGPKYGVPLACLAAAVAISFVNCNRHYVSQIVAGAALGTIYALAADKFVSSELCQDVRFNAGIGKGFSPHVRVSYAF